MSKKLDRLRHLVAKMQGRYGESDPDIRQLAYDLAALEALEADERDPTRAKRLQPNQSPTSRSAQAH